MNYLKKIEILDFHDFRILISIVNGASIIIENDKFLNDSDLIEYLKANSFFYEVDYKKSFDRDHFKTIYISLHISSQCNMACEYCFNKNRGSSTMSFEDAKKFIDMIISEYPNAGKYIVDPTGSGEPLLKKQLLYKIGEYCKEKSNQLKKEVLPMIVTNGTLLDKQTVKEIRKAGILFGVSLDGDKIRNDYYRKDVQGNSVFRSVLKNVKNIKDRSLMGVAVTLTDKNTDLVKMIKYLIKFFPTISIKPVRAINNNIGINIQNIEEVKKQYTKLLDFLINETQKGNLTYIASLLNGDDYFGKFIYREILNLKVSTRCDAGIGRFSLAQDENIYVCPGAIGINELKVGSLNDGINFDLRERFYSNLVERNECSECFARFSCGGECMVNSHYSKGGLDEPMCLLKRHLYKLASLFHYTIRKTIYYESIRLACVEKADRFKEDIDITNYLTMNPHVNFMDVKMNRNKYNL